MTSLSDTLAVGLVLVLLFGSIALYLYTRIQQAEQKISLLESILLDMKMGMEIKSFTKNPDDDDEIVHGEAPTVEHYAPFTDDDHLEVKPEVNTDSLMRTSPSPSVSSKVEEDENEVEQYKSVIAEAVKQEDEPLKVLDVNTSANYEAMTLKELQSIAKSRGITGAGSMKKGPIIEALKTSDRSSSNSVESGHLSSMGNTAGSFLETSSPFQAS